MTFNKYTLFIAFVMSWLALFETTTVLAEDCLGQECTCYGRDGSQIPCPSEYNKGYGRRFEPPSPQKNNKDKNAYDQGMQFYRQGDYKKAEIYFSNALSNNEGFAPAYAGIGMIRETQQNYNEAIPYYVAACDYDYQKGCELYSNLMSMLRQKNRESKIKNEFYADRKSLIEMLGSGKPKVKDAWDQLQTGLCVLGNAVAFARIGDKIPWQIDYFREMSKQATNAFDGVKINVQCPDVQAPGRPYGVDSSAPLERFSKALLKATNIEVIKIDKAEKKINRAIRKKKRLAKQSIKKKNEIAHLKEELAQIVRSQKQSGYPKKKQESRPPQNQAKKAKKSATAIALAALKNAKIVLKKVQVEEKRMKNLIKSEKDKKTRANANLAQFKNIFNQVKNDPGNAEKFLRTLER